MNYISQSITSWLISRGAVAYEDRELYEYAVYSFILSISPLFIIGCIGFMMGKLIESILVIIPFMIVRKYSGGFHLKYAWLCMIFSCCILFGCVYFVGVIKYGTLLNMSVFLSIISLMVLSPIDSENRRLDLYEKKKNKKNTIIILLLLGSIYCLLLLLHQTRFAVCIAEGIVLTASLQWPCVVDKIFFQKKRKM